MINSNKVVSTSYENNDQRIMEEEQFDDDYTNEQMEDDEAQIENINKLKTIEMIDSSEQLKGSL